VYILPVGPSALLPLDAIGRDTRRPPKRHDRRQDEVEISDAGREKAAHDQDAGDRQPPG